MSRKLRKVRRALASFVEWQWSIGGKLSIRLYNLSQSLTSIIFSQWKRFSLVSAKIVAWLRKNNHKER